MFQILQWPLVCVILPALVCTTPPHTQTPQSSSGHAMGPGGCAQLELVTLIPQSRDPKCWDSLGTQCRKRASLCYCTLLAGYQEQAGLPSYIPHYFSLPSSPSCWAFLFLYLQCTPLIPTSVKLLPLIRFQQRVLPATPANLASVLHSCYSLSHFRLVTLLFLQGTAGSISIFFVSPSLPLPVDTMDRGSYPD